jgi:hypothetical protein
MNIPPDRHIQKFYAFTWQSSASHKVGVNGEAMIDKGKGPEHN